MYSNPVDKLVASAKTDVSGKWIPVAAARDLVHATILECASRCDRETAQQLLQHYGIGQTL